MSIFGNLTCYSVDIQMRKWKKYTGFSIYCWYLYPWFWLAAWPDSLAWSFL